MTLINKEMTFRQYLDNLVEMNGVKYSFSSVQINFGGSLAHKIVQWGEHHIKESDLFSDPDDPSFGREDEMHITVLYGIHTTSLNKIKNLLKGQKPFEVNLGKVTMFDKADKPFSVVKIDVESEELKKLHDMLKNSLKVTVTYPIFRPHITIAYIKKKHCEDIKGNRDFEKSKLPINYLTFSSKDGTKTKIKLG